MRFCHPPPDKTHPPRPRSLPSASPKSRQSSAPLRREASFPWSGQPAVTRPKRPEPSRQPGDRRSREVLVVISSNRRPSPSATSGRVLVGRHNHRRAMNRPRRLTTSVTLPASSNTLAHSSPDSRQVSATVGRLVKPHCLEPSRCWMEIWPSASGQRHPICQPSYSTNGAILLPLTL